MNDSYSVEILRKRVRGEISPQTTTTWATSGRYDDLVTAQEWANTIKEHKDVLGVRIVKHTWSSECIYEEVKK